MSENRNNNNNNSNSERIVEISQKTPQSRVDFNRGSTTIKNLDKDSETKPRQQNP